MVESPRPGLGLRQLRRLGKNINGYFGETIQIAEVLSDCVTAAREHGWQVEQLRADPTPGLLAFVRAGHADRAAGEQPRAHWPDKEALPACPRVYISTGIHGDEPAGPLTVRRLLQENRWPTSLDLWLCPCLNPAGFALNRRESPDGLDLNRQYLDPKAPETLAHIAWLARQPAFDLSLCLHEDWESNGFYIYELNPDNQPSLAPLMLERVAQVCPVDQSEVIEGRPAEKGIIRPSIDPRSRPDWPEAFFLLTHKTRLSYTLEAPSDFPLLERVTALVTGVRAAVELIAGA